MVDKPRNQYLQTQVMTASKEQLILMLYDGFARFCENAKKSWKEDNLEEAHKALVKAQSIILELAFALDKENGGIIAANLAQLYTYCYSRLVTANIERSTNIVEEVQGIVSSLRDAWGNAMGDMPTDANSAPQAPGISVQTQVTSPSTSAAPVREQKPNTKPNGVPLAKIPVKRIAVPASSQEQGSRLSVEG